MKTQVACIQACNTKQWIKKHQQFFGINIRDKIYKRS